MHSKTRTTRNQSCRADGSSLAASSYAFANWYKRLRASSPSASRSRFVATSDDSSPRGLHPHPLTVASRKILSNGMPPGGAIPG